MLYMVTFTINIAQMLAYINTIHGSYGLGNGIPSNYPSAITGGKGKSMEITRNGGFLMAKCSEKSEKNLLSIAMFDCERVKMMFLQCLSHSATIERSDYQRASWETF